MINNESHQFSVAEEVHPVRVDGLPVLGPAEGGDGVALHGRGDPQPLALVHGDVAQGTSERGLRLVHALLHAGLDRDVAGRAGLAKKMFRVISFA